MEQELDEGRQQYPGKTQTNGTVVYALWVAIRNEYILNKSWVFYEYILARGVKHCVLVVKVF